MTTLEKIRAEIEMEKNTFKKTSTEYKDIFHQGKFCAFDESLRIIDKYAEQEPCDDDYQTDMDEAWKQAKREPCDDAVSRQAVLEIVDEEWLCNADYDFRSLVESIEQLPSVRPQEQTGHWEFFCQHWRKCSECEYPHKFAEDWNYCPNCGARMIESQESKAKNEIHCACTDEEIAKSFIEDVEAVKELLPRESEG